MTSDTDTRPVAPASNTQAQPSTTGHSSSSLNRATTFLLACACGLIAANLYYVQPLAGPISADLGLSEEATGLVVTLTQLGYSLGLLLIVPLADLIENRKLVLMTMGLGIFGLLCSGSLPYAETFLFAAFLTGLGSVAVQILLPYAAHLSSEAERGRAVGNVMSGLMAGIMLARPVASFIAEYLSWPAVFYLAAAVMALLSVALYRRLPQRMPTAKSGIVALLLSMGRIAMTQKVLQRRALYQALLFASFSAFWTTVPLLLASPDYGLSHGDIALFALVGAAGAIAAPIAGRIADKGWTRIGSALAMGLAIISYLLPLLADTGSTLGLILLAAAAVILDFGVSANLIFGQRAIFILDASLRSRLNAIYMTTFYLGGALGSAIGGWAYATGDWSGLSMFGIALPVLALGYFATERAQVAK
ncbi:MAG: MFS transporter [Rhodobacteraceae bacterium]|nr:MFS transporter [Paracoccaceae bacterium]